MITTTQFVWPEWLLNLLQTTEKNQKKYESVKDNIMCTFLNVSFFISLSIRVWFLFKQVITIWQWNLAKLFKVTHLTPCQPKIVQQCNVSKIKMAAIYNLWCQVSRKWLTKNYFTKVWYFMLNAIIYYTQFF